MSHVITYTNSDGGTSVVTPAPGYADSLEALAAQVVPAGVDYLIIPSGSLPPPPEPTPEERRAAMTPITARQLRLTLRREAGITPAMVEGIISGIEDEGEREDALIEWEYASHYERLHPLIAQVADALELTDEAVDALWDQALTA